MLVLVALHPRALLRPNLLMGLLVVGLFSDEAGCGAAGSRLAGRRRLPFRDVAPRRIPDATPRD